MHVTISAWNRTKNIANTSVLIQRSFQTIYSINYAHTYTYILG